MKAPIKALFKASMRAFMKGSVKASMQSSMKELLRQLLRKQRTIQIKTKKLNKNMPINMQYKIILLFLKYEEIILIDDHLSIGSFTVTHTPLHFFSLLLTETSIET